MDSNQLRTAFLEYFRERGHEVVPSSSLVPGNDPTLMFTNAGMVQFKDVFLGNETRGYTRAVSSQRCVRAGGKHNDLENVGYTARHHTFFEMLGNFSFGEYFKREAINYAWEFLTRTLGLPESRLWVTVYESDDEAAEIWLEEVGVSRERFSRCGEQDNFWSMGDTGPCGPCSEIFYDHGSSIPGGPPGSPEADGDRYVEIWNLVFMQYNRTQDGKLNPIPKPSVDTGMGLERIAAVMQGVHSNYEIDIFRRLIAAIHELAGGGEQDAIACRVLADHIRACAFLIADGVIPSNEKAGYVLRRIIRRAIRHGGKLGCTGPFFHKLVDPLIEVMGGAFPELSRARDHVVNTLRLEEERFGETLELGLRHLEGVIGGMSGRVIPGADVFRLYDTYGFPVDLTADIARERGLSLDMAGYEAAMGEQRERARAGSRFELAQTATAGGDSYSSRFRGYEELQLESEVVALFKDGASVKELRQGESGCVILAETPFYAESGGQVGDHGEIRSTGARFAVTDTRKQNKAHIHLGEVAEGGIRVGQCLQASVDTQARTRTMRNHSATHLLHAALRQVLGGHVTQKGSLVAPDRLRFDFSHNQPVTAAQLREIEALVNLKILDNRDTRSEVMQLDEARKTGAMMLFGEKYEEQVRVLNIADGYSIELCGGTHVRRAGDIGLFKILAETGTAAGVRRIEAVAGEGALARMVENEGRLAEVAEYLKTDPDQAPQRLAQVLERTRRLEKELDQLKSKVATSAGADLHNEAVEIGGLKVLARKLDGADPKTLRETVDRLKDKLGSAVLVLAAVEGQKVSLVAGVTPDAVDRVQAGKLVNFVAGKVGGKGGGRADLAQAGGTDPAGLAQALADVSDWVRAQLQGH
ncbi:MAG: alanine--tRNA ligase [Gammaproteobacteria bacterium]|nr:MAG: alanine--tRNA ligase [Gammaproteobacteria bacterium]